MFILRLVIGILITTIFLIGMPGIKAQSDDGLVAEWHFDEGSGTITKDSSGLGKHGTFINNPLWTTGKFDYGVQTSGEAYISVPAVDLADEWSITAWFLSPIPTNQWAILTRGSNDAQIVVSYGKDLGTYDTAVGSFHDCGWDINTLPGGWHHIVAVGKIDGQTYFYIDGDYKCSSNYRSTTDVVSIGNRLGVYSMPWGTIDEVRIYNRVLSEDEIKAQYEGTHLTLTKTASPQSIKQGQSTTITLTAKNTGSTDIYDIEIADTIPSDLIFIEGETSKIYEFLGPKDSRQFQYVLQFDEAGTFNFAPASASYADMQMKKEIIRLSHQNLRL